MQGSLTQVNVINYSTISTYAWEWPKFCFLPCMQAKQFRKLLLPLYVQLFFVNTIELRLFRSGPLFISNTAWPNFFQSLLGERYEQPKQPRNIEWLFESLNWVWQLKKKLTHFNSFNQITFWKIFHWVFQKLSRLTCQVRPQPMFVCWVGWNNMEAAYYDRFHKKAPIPSVQTTITSKQLQNFLSYKMYFFNPSLLLLHNHQLQELLKEEKNYLQSE